MSSVSTFEPEVYPAGARVRTEHLQPCYLFPICDLLYQKEMIRIPDYLNHKSEGEHSYAYSGVDYIDGEDGELSWFNAGVRVGAGIGLSICVGIGLGVGLLVRSCQGTTRNFRRQLL